MNNVSEMVRVLRRVAMITGFIVLLISVFFSYDGFDQGVTGGNSGYTVLATIIGIVLAVVFSVIQFIFGTNYKDLNWTLRGVGIFAYVYSIYTNYLGIKHILGADEFMAWSLAMIMDIYPEPAISWALGESLTGDALGNIGKMLFGGRGQTPQFSTASQYVMDHQNRRVSRDKSNYKAKHRPVWEDKKNKPFPPFHPVVYSESDE